MKMENAIIKIDIIVIGSFGVGKTSLAHRFVNDSYVYPNEPTLQPELHTTVKCIDGSKLKYNIWDTAGMERFTSLTKSYYIKADVAIVAYDITSIESFTVLDDILCCLQRHRQIPTPIYLCGTKKDQENGRLIQTQEGKNYSIENRFQKMEFFETSVITSENVEEMFTIIGQDFLKTTAKRLSASKPDADVIKVSQPPQTSANTTFGQLLIGAANNIKRNCCTIL